MAPHEVGLTAAQIDLSEVDPVLLSDGMELVRQEKTMSFRSAFKHHWRALAWSIGLSFALVMDGAYAPCSAQPERRPCEDLFLSSWLMWQASTARS